MSVRKTIFDSGNERELFTAIESRWSQHGYALYPSLPFASIFPVPTLDVTPEERSVLFKMSVD